MMTAGLSTTSRCQDIAEIGEDSGRGSLFVRLSAASADSGPVERLP